MREAAFVKQNANRWQDYEKQILRGELSPDAKADLFIQLTDDLSFAQTQYPTSETTAYLNQLASRVHQSIYKTKREEQNRFITYWTREIPLLFASLRKPMFYSLVITLIATAIGAVSAIQDETFVRLIMGDGYVNMTLENIKNGNVTGVYGSSDQVNMFFAITFNNIRVSFYAFAMGIFFSFGTGYILFRNGVMLGAFFTLFYQHSLLTDSILVVMLHGTLEISAIILAGGAGLRMGNSILFPGTYSRLDSFKAGAKDGLKVVMGLMPVFIVAGFIESFVTRYANMPTVIKGAIILASLSFIIYYFFILPVILSKKYVSKN
ncbi:MAG: stage II sporulation protein M [Bacteroidetes bacterium]|nr:stage II sporulation protein M [Bacteroidota bacterium]